MSEEITESKIDRPRLKIQGDLPIRTVGIETERERTNYSDLPPQNYLHVWWARRPTPASRLAILGSVLPDSVDDDTLLRWMGIIPNNITDGVTISEHVRQKKRTEDDRDGLVYEHYGYRKSYKNLPTEAEMDDLHDIVRETWDGDLPTLLDATAGGGSIPFESVRYGLPTIANELNPVASVILQAVLKHPRVDGDLSDDIRKWGERINELAREELSEYFPSKEDERVLAFLWAHTINCPDCGLELPLSPTWWVHKESGSRGTAAQPIVHSDKVDFEIVEMPSDIKKSEFDPSNGTVSRGKATCIQCSVTIDGDEIKRQAQAGEMEDQIYAVYHQPKARGENRGFRAPTTTDIDAFNAAREKAESDIDISTILTEERYVGPADRSANYGVTQWRDIFSPRQLLTHYTYWRSFEEVKDSIYDSYSEEEADAILTFLALASDKALDYNSRISSWHNGRSVIRNGFERHDFSFKWSYAENNLLAEGIGYDWVLDSTVEVYEELRELSAHSAASAEISQQDAASLSLENKQVDTIVLDPPYYDNVMYAELSDFFYVWLKKYLGDVYPDFFKTELTPKGEEAVADRSKFRDLDVEGRSRSELAKEDYEQKMTGIFEEMHRVLSDEGVFTLMFTHKKTEAWDTLTKALIEAGFVVTSTHPISTESRLSLHQAGKNAAESTILLASEKRLREDRTPTLWQEIKRVTRKVAQDKAKQLDQKEVDFSKVDIILASFGPTLEVFTKNYPVIDDEGNDVRPQVALDEARSAVREYLINQYLNEGVEDVDPITEWYI